MAAAAGMQQRLAAAPLTGMPAPLLAPAGGAQLGAATAFFSHNPAALQTIQQRQLHGCPYGAAPMSLLPGTPMLPMAAPPMGYACIMMMPLLAQSMPPQLQHLQVQQLQQIGMEAHAVSAAPAGMGAASTPPQPQPMAPAAAAATPPGGQLMSTADAAAVLASLQQLP